MPSFIARIRWLVAAITLDDNARATDGIRPGRTTQWVKRG